MDWADFLVLGAMGFRSIVLLVVVLFIFQVLVWAALLRIAARFISVDDATFGRAFLTAVFMAILMAALSAGLIVISPTGGVTHWTHGAAIWLVLMLMPIVAVELVRSGLRTTRGKAFGVLYTSTGLLYVAFLYLWGTVMAVLWITGRDDPAQAPMLGAP